MLESKQVTFFLQKKKCLKSVLEVLHNHSLVPDVPFDVFNQISNYFFASEI